MTGLLLAGIAVVAVAYTGLVPTEASIERFAWDRSDLQAGRWDVLFLSMFAHGGFLHLVMNSLALMSFGPVLERWLGPFRFAAVYLAAGIGGGIAHALVEPTIPVVGASGAIFGLLGVLVVLRPNAQLQLFGLIPVPFALFGVLYAALLPWLLTTTTTVPIAHAAHFGGLVVGCVAGLLIDPLHAVLVFPGLAALYFGVSLIVQELSQGPPFPPFWRFALYGAAVMVPLAYFDWVERRRHRVTCPECGRGYPLDPHDDRAVVPCPHCGSRNVVA